MINRALSDQLIKKDIMQVSDIYMPLEKTVYLQAGDTIANYHRLSEKTGHSRFPVVNKSMRVLGVVTAKDVLGKAENQAIERVMTREPNVVKQSMSVASVSHQMIWDGLEMMPVVKDDLSLVGMVSRQDVMKAMQLVQRQPQMSNTISDQIVGDILTVDTDRDDNPLDNPYFKFEVTPQMVNSVGTISFGVLSEIVANVAQRSILIDQRRNTLIEQMNLYYLRLIQLESEIEIHSKTLELGRRSAKVDLEVYIDNVIVAKAIVLCQVMERS
jgi:predicted transcriptional regulator